MSKKIISIVLSLAIMCVFMPTVAMAGTYSANVNNNKIELSESTFNTLLDLYTGTQSPVKFLAKDLRSAAGQVPLTVKTLDKTYQFAYTVESSKLSEMKYAFDNALTFEEVFPLLLSDKVSTSAVKPIQNKQATYTDYTFAKGYPVFLGYALKGKTTVKVEKNGEKVANAVTVTADVIADKAEAVAQAKGVITKVTTKAVTVKKGKKKVKYVKLTYGCYSGTKNVNALKNKKFTPTYKFYRATKKTGKYSLIGKTTKTSFTYKKAKAKKTYYYKVVVSYKAPDNTVVSTDISKARVASKKL